MSLYQRKLKVELSKFLQEHNLLKATIKRVRQTNCGFRDKGIRTNSDLYDYLLKRGDMHLAYNHSWRWDQICDLSEEESIEVDRISRLWEDTCMSVMKDIEND